MDLKHAAEKILPLAQPEFLLIAQLFTVLFG